MDYMTKPISREKIRTISKAVREIFKCRNKFYFDVVEAFEKLPLLFPEVTTAIVEDDNTEYINDLNCPAAFVPFYDGKFIIYVREKTYNDAVKGKGGPRAHIMHEISHFILFKLGYTPILERSFKNNEINPPYISFEWQAKALAGEVLIPFTYTSLMSVKSIMKRCKVSKECAETRRRLDV